MTGLLETRALVKRFGGITALDGVDVSVRRGEVVGVIGVNGAGKTTLMNCVCGLSRPDGGEIFLDGKRITRSAPHDIAHLGVGRTFQVPRVFRRMSLLDNLLVPVLDAAAPDWELERRAAGMLERMQLLELRHNHAEELSGGQQKLLEMARMLMREPKVVLLDEPFAGVHPTLCRFMIEQIEAMAAAGTSVLLISHDLTSIYRLSDRIVALNQGQIIAEGDVEAIRGNPAVIEAYLGT
jgi:branched-chain amino acid transport system ATP-binding protein